MRTFTVLIIAWIGLSSFHVSPNLRAHFDAFEFLNGKWRGKGWHLKNDVKIPFDKAQWVKNEKNEKLSIYGFSQKINSKEKPINFSQTLLWDSIAHKQAIRFTFKDNFQVITSISPINDTDWRFQFYDEFGESYRYTWQTNKSNIWVETCEALINGSWLTFSKSVLEKQEF